MPAIFNRAGYDTFRTCKRGNSYEAANALFKTRRDATKRDGTAEGGSAWHAEQVLEYLNAREKTEASDPFLIYFGFSHPHDPRTTQALAAVMAPITRAPDKPNRKRRRRRTIS
ncbi:MAG: hypothetical protein R3F11_01205 [Verrucomicrobiales bacterium]